MNEKKELIDSFLHFWRDIAKSNPDLSFKTEQTHNMIYSKLVRMVIEPEQCKFNIKEECFQEWINYFQNKNNIDVFVSPSWRYFCQFVNNKNQIYDNGDHLKIYFSFDPIHMEKSTKLIFDFLSSNNIPHLSKVGSNLRFDSVVVRLIDPQDVDKLLYFVRNNAYIQEGLLKPNPFAFNYNGIALACDGYLSYNSIITDYIRLYINDCQNKNRLEQVNFDDFYQFINLYYQSHFFTIEGIDSFIEDFNLKNNCSSQNIVNYQNVTSLILKSIKKDFSYQKYIEHYRECIDSQKQHDKILKINNLRMTKLDESEIKTINQTLLHIIDVMSQKYNRDFALNNLKYYLKTNEKTYLTRSENIRDEIHNSNFRTNLLRLLKQLNMSFDDYIKFIQNDLITNSTQNDETILEETKNIIDTMMLKYSYHSAVYMLKTYIEENNPLYLTRTNNLRDQVSNSNFRENIIKFMKEKNITFEEIIAQIKDFNPSEILDNAIIETYKKYDLLYQNGQSHLSGEDAATVALKQVLQAGSYIGFTRQNNARQRLKDNLTQEQIIQITKDKLKYPNNKRLMSYKEIDLITEQYIEMVINDYLAKQKETKYGN